MSEKYHGGYVEGCLTLRDYFAAKALQGLLADTDESPSSGETLEDFMKALAIACYEYADAMMEARK